MTKQDHIKKSVNIARKEWFKDHLKQPTTDPKCFLWRKPESSIYYINYIISVNHLIVTGDAGDAIYAWGQTLTWEWLADLELDYFVSKCIASEEGRPYVQWSQRVASAWLDEWKKEHPTLANGLDETYSIGSRDEFQLFLMANAPHFDYEDSDAGEVLNIRAIGHWVGIQMMFGSGKRLDRYL